MTIDCDRFDWLLPLRRLTLLVVTSQISPPPVRHKDETHSFKHASTTFSVKRRLRFSAAQKC